MKTAETYKRLRGRGVDIIIALLVFCVVFCVGYGYLRALSTGERSAVTGIELLYGPSVMLAQSRGFIEPDILEYPVLRAFLRGEIDALPPDAVPETVIEHSSPVASYHRYLVYTVAFFWRILGISWTSLEPLLALLLAWSGVAVYGLMRLGMRRSFAFPLALVFMISPAMLGTLTELRDFSKAPFILSMLWGLGWLIKNRVGFRQLIFWSVYLGFVAGLGMGFRQDIFVFVPLALASLTVAAFRVGCHPWRWMRLAAVPVCLACFYALAWPMMGHMEGGAHPGHHLVQGFTNKRLDNLGMLPAAYRPMASGLDQYIFSALYDHMQRQGGDAAGHFTMDTAGSDLAGQRWLRDAVRHFPADLAARGYAAVLRNLRYADAYPPTFMVPGGWYEKVFAFHRGLATHLHRYGLLYGLAALLVLAVYQPLAAFGMFLFALYVLGYIALQCEYRHAFHLALLPFWILGFLIECCIVGIGLLRRRGMPSIACWKEAAARLALFSGCCLALLIPPLVLLRLHQERQIRPLLELGVNAERKPVSVVPQSAHGWTLFAVKEDRLREPDSDIRALCTVLAAACSPELRLWHVRGRLMAAEFKADAGVDWLIHKYDSAIPVNDFSQLTRLPHVSGDGDVVKYYFPVYELLMPYNDGNFLLCRGRFRGIAVPEDKADAFLGLYEVSIPDDMNMLMQFAHLDDRLPEALYQRIGLSPDPLFYYQSEKNAVDNLNLLEAARCFGRAEEARFMARAQLVLSRQPETRLFIAGRLLEDGSLEDALDAALDIQGVTADERNRQAGLLEMIGRQFLLRQEPEPAERAFAAAWSLDPSKESTLRFELAVACGENEADKALEQYRIALSLEPDSEQGCMNTDLLLERSGTSEQRVQFWRDLAERHPGSLYPSLRLGMALEASGDEESAARAYAAAFQNHKDHPETMVRYVLTRTDDLDFDVVHEALDRALSEKPELTVLAVQYLDKAGRHMLESGRTENAISLYALAVAYQPDNKWIKLGQARCLARAGRTEEALEHFEGLLDSQYGRDALMEIRLLLPESGKERLAYWQDLEKRHSGNEILQDSLAREIGERGRVLFEEGAYKDAVEVLQSVCPEPCTSADLMVLLCLSRIAAVGDADCVERMLATVKAQPETKPRALGWAVASIDRLAATGALDRAELLGRAAVTISPEMDTGWLALIRVYRERGEEDNALAVCREAIANVEDITQLAQIMDGLYSQSNAPEERLREWERLRESLPVSPVALMHLARAYEANGRWREAADVYAALTDAGTISAELKLYQGCALIRAGDWEQGMVLLREGMEMGTASTAALSLSLQEAGNALLDAGRLAAAEDLFHKAAGQDSESGFPLLRLGEARWMQGKSDAALGTWGKVLTVDPHGPAAAQAARLLYRYQAPEARLEAWRTLSGKQNALPLVTAYYALALAASGEMEQAADRVALLLQEHPDCPEAVLASGVLACLLGDMKSGVEGIRGAIKDRPELVGDVAAYLSEAALKDLSAKNLSRAEALLRAAQALEPDNLSHCMNLGEVLLEQGRADEAIEQFRRLLMVVPDSPRTAGLMDVAYRLKQDSGGHVQAWREIRQVHPDAALPIQRLKELEDPQ